MPTYRNNLASLIRKMNEIINFIVDKHDNYKVDKNYGTDECEVHQYLMGDGRCSCGEASVIRKGIKLNIVERAKLVELKSKIDNILKDCENDGY